MTSTDISFINTINRITMLWLNSQNPPFFLPMAKYIVEINRWTLQKQIGESVCNKGKSTSGNKTLYIHFPLLWDQCTSYKYAVMVPFVILIILDRNLQGNRLLVSFARLFGVLVGQSHKHNDEDGSWGGNKAFKCLWKKRKRK